MNTDDTFDPATGPVPVQVHPLVPRALRKSTLPVGRLSVRVTGDIAFAVPLLLTRIV